MGYAADDPKLLKIAKAKALLSFTFFTRYFFKKLNKRSFIVAAHHYVIFQALERVLTGKSKRLIINIAPRYGKTEIAVINFIAHGLALNPQAKFIHLSYADDLALENSLRVKDIVQSAEYQQLFPHVQVRKDVKAKEKWYTTQGGGVLARATGGQVTGFGAGLMEEELKEMDEWLLATEQQTGNEDKLDAKFKFGGAIIIDDPIKPEDADSDTIRAKINERYDSTIKNRTNSRNTPIVLICQRTHPEDLAGYLQRENSGDNWEVISLPCINQQEFAWYDGDKALRTALKGAPLWEYKHTLEELHLMEKANEVVYMRQYMQDPEPKAGLLFPRKELNYYEELPAGTAAYIHFPSDPANKGGDDFSGIVGRLYGNKIYITECIYNTDGEDINSTRVVELTAMVKPNSVHVEGILNWAETALNIFTALDNIGYEGETRVLRPRTQKDVRIKARASFIKNHFVFRKHWQDNEEYAKFFRCLTSYKKIQLPGQENKRDDAPDNCEMMATFYFTEFPGLWPVEYKLENATGVQK